MRKPIDKPLMEKTKMKRPTPPTREEIVARELLLNANGISEREIAMKYDKYSMRNEVTAFERENGFEFERTKHKTADGLGEYFKYKPKNRPQAQTLIKIVNIKAKARGGLGFSEREEMEILSHFN